MIFIQFSFHVRTQLKIIDKLIIFALFPCLMNSHQPDITAPGVNIIAAYTQATSPTDQDFDKRRVPFNTESGTSMSCPHVSGVVGLLKTLYPHWSPSAIRSAIMTTGDHHHYT